LDEEVNIVPSFFQIFDSILASPARYVLDDIALEVPYAVGVDVLDRLNPE
jgi:hypothetical protein